MKVTINTKIKDIPNGSTVEDLKQQLALPKGGMAVAVNGTIVPSSSHASHALKEGDDIVIIGAAYGG